MRRSSLNPHSLPPSPSPCIALQKFWIFLPSCDFWYMFFSGFFWALFSLRLVRPLQFCDGIFCACVYVCVCLAFWGILFIFRVAAYVDLWRRRGYRFNYAHLYVQTAGQLKINIFATGRRAFDLTPSEDRERQRERERGGR